MTNDTVILTPELIAKSVARNSATFAIFLVRLNMVLWDMGLAPVSVDELDALKYLWMVNYVPPMH